MPAYRADRMPGGSYHVRQTTWEDETAGALVGGAATAAGTAAGWVIGSGISGLRSLARSTQDRRLQRAAEALEAASESGDNADFLTQARDFTRRYPQLEYGQVALSQALQRRCMYDGAIDAVDRAVQLGLDETEARMIRADIYEDAGQRGKAIQELSVLVQAPDAELRQISLLMRARQLIEIGDLPRALSDADAALSVQPDEFAYALRGHVHRAMGNLDTAVEDYTRALNLSPGQPELLQLRADVLEELGRPDEGHAGRAAAGVPQEGSAEQQLAAMSTADEPLHVAPAMLPRPTPASARTPAAQRSHSSSGPKVLGIASAVLLVIGIASGAAALLVFAVLGLLGGVLWARA